MSLDPTIQALNQSVLAAHGWPEFAGDFDLLGDQQPDVPPRSGVYALLTNDGETLRYPNL